MTGDAAGAGHVAVPNGGALAAVLATAIGSFALGVLVILNEAKIFVAPSLYPPSGGLSGRTTFAVIIWLVTWRVLHVRWRERELSSGPIHTASFALVALGVLMLFPPLWDLL